MKSLLAALLIAVVPGLSLAGEGVVLTNGTTNFAPPTEQINLNINSQTPSSTPMSSALPDIFFSMAHTCQVATTTCLPDNLVTNPFGAVVSVYVPSTQSYTRYYFVTDMQGAVVSLNVFTSSMSAGSYGLTLSPISLSTGQMYRFFVIVQGANGKVTVSDSYNFKVI